MGFSLFGRKKPKRPVGDGPAATAPLAELFSKEAAPSVEAAVETLPRFKASAADQIDRRQSGRLTDMRMKLRNAFTPSQPVASREMFAGLWPNLPVEDVPICAITRRAARLPENPSVAGANTPESASSASTWFVAAAA